MTWPLDVFYAACGDAVEFRQEDDGNPDKRRKMKERGEALKEQARQRAGGFTGWWSNG